MSISPVSSMPPPAIQASQAAKSAPVVRDRDGDHDNNKAESSRSESSEGGQRLNIKA
jgi:hypothetical protein